MTENNALKSFLGIKYLKNLLKQNVYVGGIWLSIQWQILGMFPHSIVSYSYCPLNSRC